MGDLLEPRTQGGSKRVMASRPAERYRVEPYPVPRRTPEPASSDLFAAVDSIQETRSRRVTLARPAQVAVSELLASQPQPQPERMAVDEWVSQWQGGVEQPVVAGNRVAVVDPRNDLFGPMFGGLMDLPRPRLYRSLDKDPFCTNASFFASGKYRPTAHCPRDRHEAPHFVPRREHNRGPLTGAARCEGPRVNRKYGENTRSRVMPFRRYTHMSAQDGFAADVVGSEPLPSFIPSHAALGQSGSSAVLAAAHLKHTLGVGKPGSTNPILDG